MYFVVAGLECHALTDNTTLRMTYSLQCIFPTSTARWHLFEKSSVNKAKTTCINTIKPPTGIQLTDVKALVYLFQNFLMQSCAVRKIYNNDDITIFSADRASTYYHTQTLVQGRECFILLFFYLMLFLFFVIFLVQVFFVSLL